MKFSCLQENLNKALLITNRFIASKPQLPVLANVLLSASQGKLKLKATNLESGITTETGAKIEKEGEITIPAKTLSEFINQLPAEKIDFQVQENNLEISCQKFQATISGMSASEFPPLPTVLNKPSLIFKKEEIAIPITRASFAAAQDESRPVLSGIRISGNEKEIVLAATDGFRLSVVKVKKTGQSILANLIFPARTLMEVVRILDEEKENEFGLEITQEANQVIFKLSNAEIVCRLLEGQFPDFEKIMPTNYSTRVIINKEEFLSAIKTTSIFAREAANIIKFQISPSTSSGSNFQISANAPQVGRNTVELDAKIDGEGGEIAFNSRFLLDYLNVVSEEEVVLEMTGPLSPGVFKIIGDETFIHVIMPVRVQPEGSP